MASQILITGATGFIGRHLTRDLVAAGNFVRILARNAQKARALFGDTVEISAGDLLNPASIKQACAKVDVVYHIAGIFRFGVRHRRNIHLTNITGTENLLEAAHAMKAGKVVHLSSASVLGTSRSTSTRDRLLDETDFPAEPPRFSPYKFSKWQAECRVQAWVKRGLPVVIANPTCPLGAGDETPTPTGQIIRDFTRGRFPCYSRVGLNFVNVSDVVTGLQRAASTGRVGERYLLSDQNLWLKEFLDLLAEETGIPSPRLCLPNWSVRAMGGFGELCDYLNPRSPSARLCLETALQAGEAQFFSNAKARTELGWAPAPIQSGLLQALASLNRSSQPGSLCETLSATKSHVR
jgi:dihydroflavonol-4-reductase